MSSIIKGLLKDIFKAAGCPYFNSVALEHIDLQLASILKNKRNGVFIEAGANDGVSQSNTYYLEKTLGWTGLLVEPIPELAAACKKSRKRSKCENFALVRHGYPSATVNIFPANLMSVVSDGTIDDAVVLKHVETGRKIQNIEPSEPLIVPTATLASLLAKHEIKHVDFFSLDVEGYELEVLSGVDFSSVNINRIFVETRSENELPIRKSLLSVGYEIERVWINPDYSNFLFKRSGVI